MQTSGRRRLRAWLPAGAGLALAALLCTSCVAETGARGYVVYGYPAVQVEYVPAEIHLYPRAYYRGRYAYWVDDRWYYPSDRGWVVFREEPRELRRYRIDHRDRFYRAPVRRQPTYRPDRYRAPELGTPRERDRRRYPR